jgi:chromosome segregation protein
VQAPKALARGLAQIGLVEDEEGASLQVTLATGQMLVSKAGTVWRWDGFVRKADAPSAAAVKLAERNRLSGLIADRKTGWKRGHHAVARPYGRPDRDAGG